jgi:hypothetical protein
MCEWMNVQSTVRKSLFSPLQQTFQQLKPQQSDVVKRGTPGPISSPVTLIMLLAKS